MRKVLAEVARTGLPGNHHFFITFLTGAPGVRVSPRLREKYPEQMTIVIQFQYWDLKVSDTGFEVGLSFSDVPERLEIPFSAVRGFYDPSVNFELEFDVKTEDLQRSRRSPPSRRRAGGYEAAAPRRNPRARRSRPKPPRNRLQRRCRLARAPTSLARRLPQEVAFRQRRQPPHGPQAQGSGREGTGGCRKSAPSTGAPRRSCATDGRRKRRRASSKPQARRPPRPDCGRESCPQALRHHSRPPHELLAGETVPRRSARHRGGAKHHPRRTCG